MTTIKASCPMCGDVDLSRDQVRLVLHPVRDRSFYSFTCNGCNDEVCKLADVDVVRLLRLAGVVPERLPAELHEAHEGAPLNYDDLCDFLVALTSTPDHLILQLAGA